MFTNALGTHYEQILTLFPRSSSEKSSFPTSGEIHGSGGQLPRRQLCTRLLHRPTGLKIEVNTSAMLTTTKNQKTTEETVTQPGGGPSNVAGVAGGASVAGSGRETGSEVTNQEGYVEVRWRNVPEGLKAPWVPAPKPTEDELDDVDERDRPFRERCVTQTGPKVTEQDGFVEARRWKLHKQLSKHCECELVVSPTEARHKI